MTNTDPKVEAGDLHSKLEIIAFDYQLNCIQVRRSGRCRRRWHRGGYLSEKSLGLTGIRQADSNEMRRRRSEWQIPLKAGNLSINPEKERITTALETRREVCRGIYATIEDEPLGRVKWHISRLEQDDLC